MARFIISAEDLTTPEADAITRMLRESPRGFWHWTESFWIVIGGEPTTTAQDLWDQIVDCVPSVKKKRMLVMRIDEPMSYWGIAPKKAWDWFRTSNIGKPN